MSGFPGGFRDDPGAHSLFCSLCADRASHNLHTPETSRNMDKDT